MYLESELGELQKKRVQMVADRVTDFNVLEMRYFITIMKEKLIKSTGISPLKVNMDWPAF